MSDEIPSTTIPDMNQGEGLDSFDQVRRSLTSSDDDHGTQGDYKNAWAEEVSDTTPIPTSTRTTQPFIDDFDPFSPNNPFKDEPSLGANKPLPSAVAPSSSSSSHPIQTLGNMVKPESKLELISDSEEGDTSPQPSPTQREFVSPFPGTTTQADQTTTAVTTPSEISTPKSKRMTSSSTPSFFGGMLRSISGSGAQTTPSSAGNPTSLPQASTSNESALGETTYTKQEQVHHNEKVGFEEGTSPTTAPLVPIPPPKPASVPATTTPIASTSSSSVISKPLASIASVFRSSSSRTNSPSGSPPKDKSLLLEPKKQREKPAVVATTPLPEVQFDFNKFLEQMRSRSADPIAKYLRSFLKEFSRKPPVAANDQVRVINDFLDFIAGKMRMVDPWKRYFVELEIERAEAEFDMAMEAMEKLVMNRLWHLTFTPAIDLSALPGEMSPTGDIERDHVLSQRIRLFAWIKPIHLDLPITDPDLLSPSHSRSTSPLPPLDLLTDDEKKAQTSSEGEVDATQKREQDRQTQGFIDFARRELNKINSYKAPRDKLICLLNCCKILFGLIRNVSNDQGADSFIPFLIYIVIKANPEHLVSNVMYIQRFRNPEKLQGEGGYYLSSLNGAISFIEHMDASSLSNMTQAEFERNVEQAVLNFPPDREEVPQRRVASSSSPAPNRPHTPSVAGHPPQHSRVASSPLPYRPTYVKPAPLSSISTELARAPQTADEDSASVLPGPSPANALETTRNFLVRSSDSVERIVSKPLGAIGRIFDQLDQVTGMSPHTHPINSSNPSMSTGEAVQHERPGSPTPSVVSTSGRRSYRSRGGSHSKNVDMAMFAAEGVPNEEVTREIDRQHEQQRLAALETLRNVFPTHEQEVLEVVLLSNNNDVGQTIDALLEMS